MSQSSANQSNSVGAIMPGVDTPMTECLDYLDAQRQRAEVGSGEARQTKWHKRGKITVRERIDNFVDESTFRETGTLMTHRTIDFGTDAAGAPTDDVVIDTVATLDHAVHVASQDFTVMGGPAGETQSRKVAATMRAAADSGTPLVFIDDPGGARIQEGIDSLSGYSQVFYNNMWLPGLMPQVPIIADPCTGGAAYSPALTNLITQIRNAQMFITGPGVIRSVTGEEVTPEQPGGADAHVSRVGNIDFVADDDGQAILAVQKFLNFLPQNNTEELPVIDPVFDTEPDPELRDIVPVDGKRDYNVHEVIIRIVDSGGFLECQTSLVTDLVVDFSRVLGHIVGSVVNQPNVMSGILDVNPSSKGAESIRFYNAFNIPLITLVDIPGFMSDVIQEHDGIIRHGIKMLYTYSATSMPKATIVIRKTYGGAYLAICSRDLGADYVLAWPTAEIVVMGAGDAANVAFRKGVATADDEEEQARMCDERIVEYKTRLLTPYVATSQGLVDNMVDPAETRLCVTDALSVLRNKCEVRPVKRHGLEL